MGPQNYEKMHDFTQISGLLLDYFHFPIYEVGICRIWESRYLL